MTTSSPSVVYIESSVFIALIQKEANRFEDCRAALREAEVGQTRAITSSLTIAEVVKGKDGLITPESEAKVAAFFQHEWLKVVWVDRRVAEEARRLSRELGLKPPDAIHVATAILLKANRLFTYDKKILDAADRLGPLEITPPIGQLVFGI